MSRQARGPGGLTRRRFAAGSMAALAATLRNPPTAAQEAATPAPAPGAAPTGGADVRTFVDDTGAAVEIPTRPRRMVALDDRTIEALLGVGAPLAGLVGRYEAQPVPPAFADLAADAVFVGIEPNLEAIARLEPDLIVGQGWMVEGVPDALRQIAPVAALDYWTDDTYTTTQWEEHFRRVADAVGRAEAAEAELARFDAAVAEFRAAFPGDPAAVELSLVHLQPEQWFAFTPLSFPGEVTARLGFSRPDAQRATDTDRIYLSYEELPLADGDAIVQAVDDFAEDAAAAAAALAAGPIWQSLGAVEAGRVFPVDGFLWLTGGSVLAGMAIIDDLRVAFGV